MNGRVGEVGCKLVCNSANSPRRQAVGSSGKAPHDICKQPRGNFELVVEEDSAQEGLEEALDDAA